MLNQNSPDLGIPNRIELKTSRFSCRFFRAAALIIVCYSFQFPFSEKAMRRDRGCAKMARLD